MSVPQPVPKWDVDTVANFISGIGLAQLVDAFKSNAVNGADLIALSDDDFTSSLGCTPLQVRRAYLPLRPAPTPANMKTSHLKWLPDGFFFAFLL
jgi:hypothetical protein